MNSATGTYDAAATEAKWQRYWAEHKTFRTPNPGDDGFDPTKSKFYVLDMFPYPSGAGLHVGHPLGYIATDVFARYKRMRGFNVLHPMGYDAFGLPAEQYAVEHGVHPRITTERNVANIREQFRRLGLGYDWDRELATTDVGYYKWTQWIFLQLFNSWYDHAQDRARPIAELLHQLENEHYHVAFDGQVIHSGAVTGLEAVTGGPPGARLWHELTPDEQRAVIDSHRLAFIDEVPVNWCPALGTVLANEEVTNEGRSERGNHPVYRRPLKQWMLRITDYAERLEKDLALVDWPESVKLMQRNWIGRSEGAEVNFQVASEGSASLDDDGEYTIRVYTTRPDTLYGATYMVLAPEHDLVGAITTDEQREVVGAYVDAARNKSDLERTTGTKEKTGVFTGAYAINPVNNARIPIWVADYVLMGYGTGAIMAVPGHDTRDLEFAEQFGLPVIQVVEPPAGVDWRGFVDDGVSVNSPAPDGDLAALPVDYCEITGLPTPVAQRKITEWLEEKELGNGAVNYKLRDWLFSRQRYWGEPFPIVHDAEMDDIYALDESELPVELPEIDDFTPAASDDPDALPQPPLGRASEWANVRGYITESGSVKLLRKAQAPPADVEVRTFRRELNTMPQWAGSCWYYLRYIDNTNDRVLAEPEHERYWMAPHHAGDDVARAKAAEEGDTVAAGITPGPSIAGGVDLYVGGVEHAVLHLLYSRFWHKVLYDLGHVSSPEPFGRLFNQGYIQGYYYEDERGTRRPAIEVVNQDGKPAAEVQGQKDQHFFHEGQPVTERYGKMGKSLKNAIAPDDIIAEHGADTLRAYELYLGPLEASKPWSTRDIVGMSRFLSSVWRKLVSEDGASRVTDDAPEDALLRLTHKTIKKVGELMNDLRFNTAIAALIELNNAIKGTSIPRRVAEPLVLMLSPFAPHLGEELWHRIQGSAWKDSVAMERWLAYDPTLARDERIEVPVQVKGKVRSRIMVAADADAASMQAAALADERIQSEIAGKDVVKIICVPGRLVNIVVK